MNNILRRRIRNTQQIIKKVPPKMTIDYTKCFVTTKDGVNFQVLDNSGDTDLDATMKLVDEYINSSRYT